MLIRWAPEMNGDWRPWSPVTNGNRAGEYVQAWNHVRAVFDQVGANNAEWVWNPIIASGGAVPLADVFPGEAAVDYTALDGYNWGDSRSWGWQTYEDIFAPSVVELATLAPNTPWFIAETGSAPGDLKDEWITDTLTRAHKDGAVGVVWFEFNKETDWRLSADADSIAATQPFAASEAWFTASELADDYWATP